MEENKGKKNKRGIVDVSVVLSFAVAIFAVFSIAMAGLSMNQKSGVSYAAPTYTVGDEFTFYQKSDSGVNIFVRGQSADGTKGFQTPLYFADSAFTKPIFCVEHKASIQNNTPYSASGTIDDAGLLYILNNSSANGVSIINSTAEVEAWATQSAIWLYLYEQNPSTAIHALTEDEIAGIVNAQNFTVTGGATATVANAGAKIRALVDTAKTQSQKKILSVTKANDEVVPSEDKKFYVSSEITVTGNPSSDFKTYDISLSGIEGAKAINGDGEEISTNVPSGTTFYVRIPAEKVTTEVQKLSVNITGHFDMLTGKYYSATDGSNKQKVVTVTGATRNESAGTEIEFVGTEDTGMSTAQTIYFIGLIVLLCGVGIVYANAKPVQVKQ